MTDILEFRSGCPFDGTHPCREEQVISVLWAAFDVDDGLDFFVGIQIQQVNDRQTFCLAAVLRHFIAFCFVYFPLVREVQQHIMRRCRNQRFDEIIIMDTHTLDTASAAFLGSEFAVWQTFDVAVMSQSQDDVFLFDQVFILKRQDFSDQQLRAAFVAESFLDFK